VIVAILRDVTLDDPRLKPWMDRQIMDLSADPLRGARRGRTPEPAATSSISTGWRLRRSTQN
jgi:hypothetical protein